MLRTNLNEILVFMAVVDAGSFIAGGQALGLTRSAAGKAVVRLEDRLGVRLLNRTTRTLSLTDEGRVFYDRGLQILAAVDDAEASVAGPAGTPRGLLRLTVADAFGRRVLLPLLNKYLEAWPEVQVEVGFTDRLADIVEEGFRSGGTDRRRERGQATGLPGGRQVPGRAVRRAILPRRARRTAEPRRTGGPRLLVLQQLHAQAELALS